MMNVGIRAALHMILWLDPRWLCRYAPRRPTGPGDVGRPRSQGKAFHVSLIISHAKGGYLVSDQVVLIVFSEPPDSSELDAVCPTAAVSVVLRQILLPADLWMVSTTAIKRPPLQPDRLAYPIYSKYCNCTHGAAGSNILE